MPAQILVPLDGSALAESVLPQAQAVAQATGRGLTLLRVVPTPMVLEPVLGMPLVPDPGAARQVADLDGGASYLQLVAGRLPGTVHTAILEGDPATVIVDYAWKHPQIEVIAMATHGRTGLGRWVLGSVAEAVLHATPVPLLLSRPGRDLPPVLAPPVYRTILVPLDGSAFAEQSLDPACMLAAATGATLVVLTVAEPESDHALAVGDIPLGIAQDGQHAVWRPEEYLRATTARLAVAGIPVTTHLAQGQPAVAILDTCESVQADLIVMATHGRQGFQRFRLGSVALQVVQGATRPVFLYRRQAAAVPQREAGSETQRAAIATVSVADGALRSIRPTTGLPGPSAPQRQGVPK